MTDEGTETIRVDAVAKAAFDLLHSEQKIVAGGSVKQSDVFRSIMQAHYPEHLERAQALLAQEKA